LSRPRVGSLRRVSIIFQKRRFCIKKTSSISYPSTPIINAAGRPIDLTEIPGFLRVFSHGPLENA
jgi:hypothetical protein